MEPDSACTTYRTIDAYLQDQRAVPEAALLSVRAAISAARLQRYLELAKGDLRQAVRLHIWNAAVAGSLMPTLQLAEITIRNVALRRLISKYGKQWYRSPELIDRRLGRSALAQHLQDRYLAALQRSHRGDLTDEIAGDMTFGFWVNIFTRKFHPHLWSAPLHTIVAGFPRQRTIEDLHAGVEFVRAFRNNVAHHNDLICKPVVSNFEKTLDVVGMLSGATRDVAEHTSTFRRVWACSPVPHEYLVAP